MWLGLSAFGFQIEGVGVLRLGFIKASFALCFGVIDLSMICDLDMV